MGLDKPQYVSDLIVHLLNQMGIEYAPLNPGATTRAIHESLVTYGENRSPELILCCHEELAVAMCEGYYAATGRPQFTLIHDIVGLQHASKAIYEAWLKNVPMIIMGGTGPMDVSHRRPAIDWHHTAQLQSQIVREYVKWDDQPEGAQSVAESVMRAYQIAMTHPRGPVYLCLDVELQESELPSDFQVPDVSRYLPPTSPLGNAEVMAQAAKALLEAERPVLVVEDVGRSPGGAEALIALAELLAIPVVEQGSGFNLPNRHYLSLAGAKEQVFRDADLVLSVGVRDLEAVIRKPAPEPGIVAEGIPTQGSSHERRYVDLLPQGVKTVHVGLRDYGIRAWSASYGRLLPSDVSILGDEVEVLRGMRQLCQGSMEGESIGKRVAARKAAAQEIHETILDKAQRDLREKWWGQRPISTARVSAEIWEAIKGEDWVQIHGSFGGWERRLWDIDDGSRWVDGSGGTGTGMGVAMGAALAFRDTDKVCVSMQKDGDLLYTAGSLWTAAHHRIPMLVVMHNNRSYYQDEGHQIAITQQRQRSMERVGVGIRLEGPETDFANLARSFQLYGDGPITEPDEVRPALMRGLKVVKEERRLAPIDTVTQPR